MKKLLITSAVLAIISSSAFAKTEGNIATLSAIYNRTTLSTSQSGGSSEKATNGGGFGIGYKYAFNQNGFFLAPGIFFEKNNIETSIGSDNINIQNRYGFKADLGYDLEDDLAIYVTGGVSFFKYTSGNATGSLSERSRSNTFYGMGLSHDYSEKVTFNLEYNTESLSLKTINSGKLGTDHNTVKVGISYKF